MEKKEMKKIETNKERVADWKTYKNLERGFLIKYPPDWKGVTEFGANIYIESEYIKIRTTGALNLPSSRTLKGEVSRREEMIKKMIPNSDFEKEDILVNQMSATRLSYIDTGQDLVKKIFFFEKTNNVSKRDAVICEIEATVFDQKESYLWTVDQIISTFQFLD